MGEKKYMCKKCGNKLEETELHSWRSTSPNEIRTEMKCPSCGAKYWLRKKNKKSEKNS